jgi:hypothetical protein
MTQPKPAVRRFGVNLTEAQRRRHALSTGVTLILLVVATAIGGFTESMSPVSNVNWLLFYAWVFPICVVIGIIVHLFCYLDGTYSKYDPFWPNTDADTDATDR